MTSKRSPAIKGAIITAIAIIIAAIIQVATCKKIEKKSHFQGTVVDATGAGIPNITVYVVGGKEDYMTESNGNFDILFSDSITSFRLRINPQNGYKAFSKSYDVPNTGVIISLEKQQ